MTVATTRRRGGLVAACALLALAVAAPSANAASFGGGNFTISLSSSFTRTAALKLSATFPARKAGSRGVRVPVDGGTATLNPAPTGNLTATKRAGFKIQSGRRTATLNECVEALQATRTRIRCKAGRSTIQLFEADIRRGKIKPDGDFTRLAGARIPLKLQSAGAKYLNRTLKPRRAFKRNQRVGTLGVRGERELTVTGGTSTTRYNPTFVQDLNNCSVTLSSLAPATAVPQDSAAPAGGVNLPQIGGNLNAVTLLGSITHSGGTVLDRPANSPAGGPQVHSELTNFEFELTNAPVLKADVNRLTPPPLSEFPIGSVQGGTYTKTLTDTGGSVTLTGANLVISDLAANTLQGDTENCTLTRPAIIGTVEAAIDVT